MSIENIPLENRFCKVFEVDGHQVVYLIVIDEETDELAIKATTFIKGASFSTTFSGLDTTKNTVFEMLDGMTQKNANVIYNSFKILTE